MAERLVKWTFFSVLVALLPLVFAYLIPAVGGKAATVTAVIGKGELFVVSASLCAAAVGDLIGKSHEDPGRRIFAYVAGGSAVVTLMLCSFLYVSASTASSEPQTVVSLSITFYVMAMLTGAGSIVLGET
jgi:hypothetical protein